VLPPVVVSAAEVEGEGECDVLSCGAMMPGRQTAAKVPAPAKTLTPRVLARHANRRANYTEIAGWATARRWQAAGMSDDQSSQLVDASYLLDDDDDAFSEIQQRQLAQVSRAVSCGSAPPDVPVSAAADAPYERYATHI